MESLHKEKPKRTFKKKLTRYQSYRPHIEKDFKFSCGYCGDSDKFYGHYHIDHFKPQAIAEFKTLRTEYENLVYSCPFCNLSKSDTWLTENEFIDPCCISYDRHLTRDERGKIHPLTENGKNMYKHLKLYLLRHELIWIIEKLQSQKDDLTLLAKKYKNSKDELGILKSFMELQEVIDAYTEPYVG